MMATSEGFYQMGFSPDTSALSLAIISTYVLAEVVQRCTAVIYVITI